MLAKPSSRPKAGPDLQAFPMNEPDLALRLEMKIGYRNIKAGSCFEFPYGVNLITGDRVSGKTPFCRRFRVRPSGSCSHRTGLPSSGY
jgi:hypothetical protein